MPAMPACYFQSANFVCRDLENQLRTERASFDVLQLLLNICPVNDQIQTGYAGTFAMSLVQQLLNVSNLNMGLLGIRLPGTNPKSAFEIGLEKYVSDLRQIELTSRQFHLTQTANLLRLIIGQLEMIVKMEKTLQEDLTTNALKKELTLDVANTLGSVVMPEILKEVSQSQRDQSGFLSIIGS